MERLADLRGGAAERAVAGALSCDVSTGALGPIRRSGRELVRRIFITVRDSGWAEVGPCEWRTEPTAAGLKIAARHQADDVAFSWEGELTLSPDGRSADFRFRGEALRPMSICRLGLIVLLPVEAVVGSRLAVDGECVAERVAAELAPQAMVDGLPSGMTEPFSELALGPPEAPSLSLEFSGELFELEDQRNWGDASFKVYCTPLRLGFPRKVAGGTIIEHAVHMTFGEASRSTPAASRPALAEGPKGPGVGMAATSQRHPHHRPSRVASTLTELRAASQQAEASTPLVDLELSEDELADLDLEGLLRSHGHRLASVRLSSHGPAVPPAAAAALVRKALEQIGLSAVPLLAATQGYFVEFNRRETFQLPVDGVAFPVSPTVHSDTLATVLENGETISEMIDAARRLTGLSRVHIAPLTWRHPARPTDSFDPEAAALWGVAAFISATRSGVDTVTLGADLVRAFLERDPAGGWLQALSEAEGSPLLPIGTPGEASFAAFASGVFLAANLGREPRTLPLPRDVRIESGRRTDGAACDLTCTGDLVLPSLTAIHGRVTLTPSLVRAVEAAS